MARDTTAAKESFFDGIGMLPESASLSQDDQDKLYIFLTSPFFRRACSLAFREVHGYAAQILGVPLDSQAAVAMASELQGKARGFTRAYESLFDLLEDGPSEEEQYENGHDAQRTIHG